MTCAKILFVVGLLVAVAAVIAAPDTALSQTAPPSQPRLWLADGQRTSGRLVGADGQGKLEFASDGSAARAVAAADLILWGDFQAPPKGARVLLASGGEWAGRIAAIDANVVSVESDAFQTLELPRKALAAAILVWPPAARDQAALAARLADRPAGLDAVLFVNGDRVAGNVEGLANGQIALVAGDSGQGKPTHFDVERVAAILFGTRRAPAEAPLPKSQKDRQPGRDNSGAWIGFADGSTVFCSRLRMDNGIAQISLPEQGVIQMPLDKLSALQPLGGRAMYLSDLPPAGYKHVPFLEFPWSYERDRNVQSGPLLAKGMLAIKGLGMHSAARISYVLDGKYRRFESELAIDDSTAGRGSVVCRVFTDDGSGNWKALYESPPIRASDPPRPVSVDVQGAKRISLLVDFGERGDEGDHLNWLNARVIP